ncbi:hypothetical protein BU25DRAFT_487546 [Macroventuria anomochaeta]|uniref:Uncharacterized protein n=1 Tax=Macroventuria anomochaeta TaxID=301207 RepID=A0ACB6SD61_9PLEO|nr:uncharacterized protein BU25DRAFT_487546 [Macroventuria anomochaeta]KAF2631969.1 hypothetical protein BU25DRAFT_487546 [Macroventuria anomochaeta]
MDADELHRDPQISPKRKRMSDSGEENEYTSGHAGAGPQRLQLTPIYASTKQSAMADAGKEGGHAVGEHASERDGTILQCHDPQGKVEDDIKVRERLVNAMLVAQKTQARACGNLLLLTNKLRGWARHLTEQEDWLYREQRQLIEQQQLLSRVHLDAATGCLKRSTCDPKFPKTPDETFMLSETEQIAQFKTVISTLEQNIEALISELQIEKEARVAAEEKLRARIVISEPQTENKAQSAAEEEMSANEE